MRYQVRMVLFGVAAISCVLSLALGLHRRGEALRRLAAYHDQAANYLLLTEVREDCVECVRSETELRRIIVSNRGEEAWLAYQAAVYHRRLAEKYAFVAGRGWMWVDADPAPPPHAFPAFAFASPD